MSIPNVTPTAERPLDSARNLVSRPPIVPVSQLRRLTMRKWEIVVHLYHDGLTYDQIAQRLEIKPRTVANHVEQIAARLPGDQPPAWKVMRVAARLIEMGYGEEGEKPH